MRWCGPCVTTAPTTSSRGDRGPLATGSGRSAARLVAWFVARSVQQRQQGGDGFVGVTPGTGDGPSIPADSEGGIEGLGAYLNTKFISQG